MNNATKLIAGLLLIVMTTIEYGDTFLLSILSGKISGFTEFQSSMFRAGHAHAGVLTILVLVALVFTDQAGLSVPMGWAVRIGGGSCSGERRVFRRGDRQRHDPA